MIGVILGFLAGLALQVALYSTGLLQPLQYDQPLLMLHLVTSVAAGYFVRAWILGREIAKKGDLKLQQYLNMYNYFLPLDVVREYGEKRLAEWAERWQKALVELHTFELECAEVVKRGSQSQEDIIEIRWRLQVSVHDELKSFESTYDVLRGVLPNHIVLREKDVRAFLPSAEPKADAAA